MKKICFFAAVLFAASALNAQEPSNLLLEECFEYDAPRPLISDPIASSDNLDPITGWSTAANEAAATNAYDIVEGNLTYPGYPGGDYGNSLHYTGDAGQGVFRIWEEGICKKKNIYAAFLLNVDNCTTEMTGSDYFFAFKMEPAANSWNWCGRIYMKVDPNYPGEEISFGIQKLSDCPIKWVDGATGPFFGTGKTMLVVVKYFVGDLYGESADEEAGHYDDEMYLYINPDVTAEPQTPTLSLIDPNAKDMYRWGTTKAFGSARGFYLRSAAAGTTPPYTIDGIRVGKSWEEVVSEVTALPQYKYGVNVSKTIKDGQLIIVKEGQTYNAQGQLIR